MSDRMLRTCEIKKFLEMDALLLNEVLLVIKITICYSFNDAFVFQLHYSLAI